MSDRSNARADTSRALPRLTMNVEETAVCLGISRGMAYDMVRQGVIPSLRLGRRIVVPQTALEDLLGGSADGQNGLA